MYICKRLSLLKHIKSLKKFDLYAARNACDGK